MTKQKSVVIIGAGVAGLATSIFLVKKGYKVDVYEKNNAPGGRCGQLIKDGHRFDLGATILLMPSLYRMVFDALGMDLDRELETTSLEPVYKLFFSNGPNFIFTRNEEKMKAQLESIEPGSFPKYNRYIKEGYAFFNIAMKEFLNRNYYNLFQFINLKSLKLLIKLKTWIKHTTYIRRFFKDKHLRMAFTFQNIYVGQNPYKSPAFFSMLPGAEIAEGALFPKGGMHRIVEKLVESATKLGVQFHYQETVSKIVTNGKIATGILLEDGSVVKSDLIVANADLPYVYNTLLHNKKVSSRINNKKYSCSAIVFHWGLDRIYPQLEHHSVFLCEPYKQGLVTIFNKKSLSDNPSFYIHAPVRSDLSAAPENHDTISVIVPIAHLDENSDQDWKKLEQIARNGVIKRLKESGIENIENHIKFEFCYTPKMWENTYNVAKGSVFGSLGHTIFQMGYFRPHNRHGRYKNLYFAGGSTHPGNGIPLVLLSAKLTSDRIIKETLEVNIN